jgi:ribosome maturation factor RimP
MEGADTEEAVFESVSELLKGIGFELVEMSISRHRGTSQARAVIYSAEGVGIDECAKVHRLIHPRLQVLLEDADIQLEVSSPGTERWLKSPREYEIFSGRGVRAYLRSESAWLGGVLRGLEEGLVVIEARGRDRVRIRMEDIAKMRLDHSEEVG